MSKGIPVDDGNAQPAACPAGTGAAASAGLGYTGNGSGLDVEVDEYDELLVALGRTEEQDRSMKRGMSSRRGCSDIRWVVRRSIRGRAIRVVCGVSATSRRLQTVAAMPRMFEKRLLR